MVALQRFNEILVKVGSWGTILFMAVIAIVIPRSLKEPVGFKPSNLT
jgi:hypothetical protein